MLNTFQTQETGNQTETVKLKTRSLHFNFRKIKHLEKDKAVLPDLISYVLWPVTVSCPGDCCLRWGFCSSSWVWNCCCYCSSLLTWGDSPLSGDRSSSAGPLPFLKFGYFWWSQGCPVCPQWYREVGGESWTPAHWSPCPRSCWPAWQSCSQDWESNF